MGPELAALNAAPLSVSPSLQPFTSSELIPHYVPSGTLERGTQFDFQRYDWRKARFQMIHHPPCPP